MEAQVAVAKIGKYATSESGDSFEMIERPRGGLSFVLVDGQRSGKPAKAISNVVARKAITLLAEGVRDGAAARAASDYLFTYRGGKVMATLNILSIDLTTNTLVITRNNPAPVLLIQDQELSVLDDPVDPVGIRQGTRPSILEFDLQPYLATVVYTDGLSYAGERKGRRKNVPDFVSTLMKEGPPSPAEWADRILEQAVSLDEGRPIDDISILVFAALPNEENDTRKLTIRMPL